MSKKIFRKDFYKECQECKMKFGITSMVEVDSQEYVEGMACPKCGGRLEKKEKTLYILD